MAIWPFGRKNKKSSKSADTDMPPTKVKPSDTILRDPRQDLAAVGPNVGRKPSHKESKRRQRSSSRKQSKGQQARNIDAEKETVPPLPTQSITTAKREPLNEKVNAPGDATASTARLAKRPTDRGDVPSYYFQNPMSTTSLQPEHFTVIPTLKAKRSANDASLPRRKSSKRKADDHAREQEIKAMSASSPIPIPRRPTSHNSGILARDSKRIPDGLNRNLQNPTSDVSLPIPESMHSTMTVGSDQQAFKVNAFDALSPHPTIKHIENPRSSGVSRVSTRKDKHPMIPEEDLAKSKKRIDDLADDMDVGTLRELMERDKKRHDRRRQSEHERLQRRLQRRAEKEKRDDRVELDAVGGSQEQEPPLPKDVGLGIGAAVAAENAEPEEVREEAVTTPESWLKSSSREHLTVQDPFLPLAPQISTTHLDPGTPTEERDEPVLETAKTVRLSQASISPPSSPTQRPQGPSYLSQYEALASRSTPDIADRTQPDKRDSDNERTWKTLFRRSATRQQKRSSVDRGGGTPSEFSNTSRESFVRQGQMPPSAFARIPRARSGTPVHTQSKFREDLPELPLSPPDSSIQSPDAEGQQASSGAGPTPRIPPAGAAASDEQRLSDIHPAFREEVAASRAQSPDVPSSAVLSQSLASVDSEGSWLTGRPAKRLSQTQPKSLRESASSLGQHLKEVDSSDEEEGTGTPDEEKYMGTITPSREERRARRRGQIMDYMSAGSGAAGGSTVETSLQSGPPVPREEGMWHSAVGKHPTIVRQGARAKSKEGLLNEFQAAEDSNESSPSEQSPISPENTFIHRATSVDLGKGHVRHVSAGSARLLNLPPRTSMEGKRLSGSSGERSPLGPNPPSPGVD